MSNSHSINSVGAADRRVRNASSESQATELQRTSRKPASWTRATASAPADKLPPWVAAAGQQLVNFSERNLPAAFNLGVYIGKNIRTFIDSRGDLRADIAAFLQNPAVLAAAATVAPRIIGALVANQFAFNAPPQVGQHPPA